MKTIWNYSWAAVAMLAALASCQKENDQAAGETLPSAPEKGRVTLTASIPAEGLTKVSFTEADNGSGKMRLTKLSWEADDVITVNGNEFTVKEGSISEDGLSATFQGEDPGNGPYNIAYTSAPDDLNNQTQPADGDAGNLGYSVSLTGADAYEEVSFTSAWAGSHGAAFAQSSVLQLRATLPAAVASAVQRVVFKSSAAIFNGRDSLTVKLTTPGTAGEDNKLDIYAMLPAGDVTLAEDMDLLVQFQVSDKAYDKYTAFRHFASGTPFIQSGATQYLGLNCSNITSYANASTTSIGTSANPYLIGDQHQMQAIALTTTKKYYILVDNIDMTDVTWSSLNSAGTGVIDLNGNEKQISHLRTPLFADLNGKVANLTIIDATVSSANTVGILANTVNTAASEVSGVTVTGCSLTCTPSEATKYMGGLVGEVSTASTFDDCHIENSMISAKNNKAYAGGAFGYVHNSDAKIGYTTKCKVAATTTFSGVDNVGGFIGVLDGGTVNQNEVGCAISGGSKIGGFVGNLKAGSLTGDYVIGAVTSTYQTVGGLIGYMEGGTVTDCYAEGDVTHDKSASYAQVGGLIGVMTNGTLTNCHATGKVEAKQSGSRVGGLIGVTQSGTIEIERCYASGNVTGKGTNVGGLIGHMYGGTATISHSYARGLVTSGGEGCGGFIGEMAGSGNKTISECYATGNFNPGDTGRPCGGFVGTVSGGAGSAFSIHDCYATGNLVTANGYQAGGFVGTISKTAGSANFRYCFATGDLNVKWGYPRGGFAGKIVTNHASIINCAAWNNNVRGQSAVGSESSGAIVGVAHPLCTLTDNYRNPAMHLWAYWGTESGNYVYQLTASHQHRNVSSTQPLMVWDTSKNELVETTKTSVDTSDGNAQFAYQGKCVAGLTLSQLASSSTYLNWGTTYWDYGQSLPRLKWTLPSE